MVARRIAVSTLVIVAAFVVTPSLAGALPKPVNGRPILGTAIREDALNKDVAYTNMIPTRYKMVMAESATTWRVIEPAQGVFNFGPMDKVVNFAMAHGLKVAAVPLLWHKENPTWLTQGTFTRAEMIAIVQNHITTIMHRYAGKVAIWDVSNEAVDPTAKVDHNVFYRRIGPDYFDIAFRTARQADPTAKLYYNDAGGEVPGGGKITGALNLINGMRSRGVPIDGVGLEMHTTILSGKKGGPVKVGALFHRPNATKLLATMNMWGKLGLEVAITEMDVRLKLPYTLADLKKQYGVYRQVYQTCIKAPNCKSLTTWGFTDRYSWVRSWQGPGWGAALPFDAQLRPKPAARLFFP
jgi:endo-1,4-beta-xylanase